MWRDVAITKQRSQMDASWHSHTGAACMVLAAEGMAYTSVPISRSNARTGRSPCGCKTPPWAPRKHAPWHASRPCGVRQVGAWASGSIRAARASAHECRQATTEFVAAPRCAPDVGSTAHVGKRCRLIACPRHNCRHTHSGKPPRVARAPPPHHRTPPQYRPHRLRRFRGSFEEGLPPTAPQLCAPTAGRGLTSASTVHIDCRHSPYLVTSAST